MKTVPLIAILVLGGITVGGATSFGVVSLLKSTEAAGAPAKPPEPATPTFVPTGKILSPLVAPTGRLAGYVQFEAMLETKAEDAEFVKVRLPLLMHAINMRTYRTPMTSGPDGMLPNLETFRTLLMACATEAFGPGRVKRVAIQQAVPA